MAASKLPPELLAFTPLLDTAEVRPTLPPLDELEAAVAQSPDDEEAQRRLRAQLEQTKQALLGAIDSRCDEENIIVTCGRVVEAGRRDFEPVYNATYGKIKGAEADGIQATAAAVGR